ncbi:MAG: NAD(P)-binding protein, partial [Polyangiaceae bacterium]
MRRRWWTSKRRSNCSGEAMAERESGDYAIARRAAVIGSGFGGLAAAIRLQTAGIRTVLYEARDKPGGRAYVYE